MSELILSFFLYEGHVDLQITDKIDLHVQIGNLQKNLKCPSFKDCINPIQKSFGYMRDGRSSIVVGYMACMCV
jgi:hypothetical protein